MSRLLVVLACALAGCGGSSSSPGAPDASSEGATTQVAIGAQCTPSQESSSSFDGFTTADAELDANNPGCGGGACLVNHFQGLTSCPYGQSVQGTPPAGQKA